MLVRRHPVLLMVFLARHSIFLVFLYTATPPPELYTLSLHDALPICTCSPSYRTESATGLGKRRRCDRKESANCMFGVRSEEHTSELQSPCNIVCRLLL